ncbi:MAG: polysaccharide biosynthesis C-terminal domain-containing protein [Bacteroidales bacterium]|nr:polysaccharide biosynthesis C-terminal domain-containing protein [Bacteroidales bacterium]
MATWIKQLAGQTAIYGVSSVVGRFLNYLLVPLYLHTFLPEEYGVVTEFYAYVVVLQIVLTYGMETGFFRFTKRHGDPASVLSTVFISIFTTSLFFVSFISLFSEQISSFLGYSNNSDYVVIFAFILGLDAVAAILFANLRVKNKAKKFAFFKLTNIFVNIFLNIFFLVLCPILIKHNFTFLNSIYKPEYGVGYIFVSNLLATIVVFLLLLTELKGIKLKFNFKLWKAILIYSLPLLLTGLTGAVNEMADKLFIKLWTVVPQSAVDANAYVLHELGIYGANAKLAVVMMMFVQAFRYAAEPFFFNFTNDSKHMLKIFADVMKYFVILAFLLFLFVMLNLDIFKYFLGKNYFEGLNVVLPLFLSRFLVGVFFVLSFWYKLNDVTAKAIFIFLSGVLVTIVLDYFLIPEVGYIGAAWTNFAAYFTMVLISFLWSRKYLQVKYEYFRILLYILIPLLFYFLSSLFTFKNIFVNLLLKNSFIFIYLLYVLKIEKIKLSNIKQLISKISKK